MEQQDDPVIENDEVQLETEEAAPLTGELEDQPEEQTEGEVVVTLGDEPLNDEEADGKPAPLWLRNLRQSNRQKDHAIRERDDEIARLKGATAQPAAVVVGEKPTLAGSEYDAEKFEKDLDAWHQRRLAADEETRQRNAESKVALDAWQQDLDAYSKAKAALKVSDFEDAESAFTSIFSVAQQAIVVKSAKRPEVMVYALGKNQKKAKELASIADPLKYARAIWELESQLKVTARKEPPPPERTIRGSASLSTVSGDKALERLRAEADKTGDRSKVAAYMNEARKKRAA